MRVKLLRRAHPEFDAKTLTRYADMFAGGAQFRAKVKDYLVQHEGEPDAVFRKRQANAHYLNYSARIINYFATWLMSCPPVVGVDDDGEVPEWASELKEDADGCGTDLNLFLRRLFVEASVSRVAYVRVSQPEPDADDAPPGAPPMVQADASRLGLDRVRLTLVPACQVTNWQYRRDESGAATTELEWLLEYTCRADLASIADEQPTITETWTQWSADGSAKRWELTYKKDQKPGTDAEAREVKAPRSPVDGIPLVRVCLPTELWLMDNISDAQLEFFRKSNALSWAMDRSCYVTPVLNTKSRKGPPRLGAGYYLELGLEETLTYPEVPAAPFQVIQVYLEWMKDEIHRVSDQMAEATDNKAANASKSAASKNADKGSTQIVLEAFGQWMIGALESILDLASEARGEDVEFSVSGMDEYSMVDAAGMVETAIGVQTIGIKSPTFQRELQKKVARAVLGDTTQSIRDDINQEIEDNVADEEVLNPTLAEVNQKLDAGFDHPADVQRGQMQIGADKAKAVAGGGPNKPKPQGTPPPKPGGR